MYSSVYGKGNNNTLFPDIKERTANQDIATVILSDPAYPLLLWLLKAYLENQTLSKAKRVFQYKLSRARMTVENTFGPWKLKGRFRRR